MAGYDPGVAEGVTLALAAHRHGLLDTKALSVVLAYYDAEGARAPAPALDVLERLGGVDRRRMLPHLTAAPAAHQRQGTPFTARLMILEPIGSGAMGMVHKAFDRLLKRVVAIKVVTLTEAGDRLRQRLMRFEREAELMARVHHPACVQVHDAGVEGGRPYLVMEYVPGRPLSGLIAEARGDLPLRTVLRWGCELARGLAACHAVGVIHRDLKPDNIMIDEVSGQPKLIDFGVARDDLSVTLTGEGVTIGTLLYMPPEQAGGKRIDGRTDVYSLGAVLYEALTGRRPLEATTAPMLIDAICRQDPPPPSAHRPDVPPGVDAVILKCLSKAPEGRFQSADELVSALERELAPTRDVAPRPPSPRSSALILCVALGGGVIGAGLTLMFARGDVNGASTSSSFAEAAAVGTVVHPQPATEAPLVPTPPTETAAAPSSSDHAAHANVVLVDGQLVNRRDQSLVVWVAAPVEFRMGSPDKPDETPHVVSLTRGFYMGKHEVTWAQYRRFCADTGRVPPTPAAVTGGDDHPVANVDWTDAQAYCRWAGGRLPTEAEWELSARGTDGRRFPWPSGQPQGRGPPANIADESHHSAAPEVQYVRRYEDGYAFTAPVSAFPDGASPYGCLNMAGNVAEWVSDWYGPYSSGPQMDPVGPAEGDHRMHRGGSYAFTDWGVRTSARYSAVPELRSEQLGFRLCIPGP